MDSTNNSAARTNILSESRAGMIATLEQAKQLSARALAHGGDLDEAARSAASASRHFKVSTYGRSGCQEHTVWITVVSYTQMAMVV